VRRYLFLLLVPVIPWTQREIEASPGHRHTQAQVLYLWSAEKVKVLSTTFRGVMADIYWLRTVQYYGGERAFGGSHYDLLLPLTDITTTLDPRFLIAYRYGSIFLSEAPPHGAGNPQAGLALLGKGVSRNPKVWELRWDMGVLLLFSLKDPARAAATLLEARKLPGAPLWLETVGAAMLGQGGERKTARQIWQRMYEGVEGSLKENAAFQLRRLEALDEADALMKLVAAFEAARGRKPASLDELLASGLLRRAPRDPSGTPFTYDPGTGRVDVSRQSALWSPPLGSPF
jgi:hypothetical protein